MPKYTKEEITDLRALHLRTAKKNSIPTWWPDSWNAMPWNPKPMSVKTAVDIRGRIEFESGSSVWVVPDRSGPPDGSEFRFFSIVSGPHVGAATLLCDINHDAFVFPTGHTFEKPHLVLRAECSPVETTR